MYVLKSAGLCLLLILLASACSDSGPETSQLPPDAQAIEANNRAVGLMGKFEYARALDIFNEIVSDRPAWNDARVNLAIATLNRQQAGDEVRALEITAEVLQDEPTHVRARYLSGLIRLYLGSPQEAMAEFESVLESDPNDAHAAYYLAQCQAQLNRHEQALPWYQRAIEADPYLRSAYYGAFQSLQRLGRQQEALALAADYQRLEHNPRSQMAEFRYTRMGPKAEALAIDIDQQMIPPEPQGALFEEPVPLPVDNVASLNWRRQSEQAMASLTTVDMQLDGRADIFLTGILDVENENGETVAGNLVLQGQDDGDYTALASHPLASVSGVNAALWGDFDNDGLVDVYLCRRGKNQLWRQVAGNNWQDVTASTATGGADLDTVDGAFFDADHDGDLDIFLVNADGPNELLNNNLDGSFRPLAAEYQLSGSDNASIMVLPVDIDQDRDVDLIVLNRTAPHEVYLNDRLWSYRPAPGFELFNNSPAQAVLAADIDADGLTELYTITPGGDLLRWRSGPDGQLHSDRLATPGVLENVSQAQLSTFDVNGDGVPDLIVSSARGWAVLSPGTEPVETLFEVPVSRADPINASTPFIGASQSGPAMLAFSAATTGLSIWQPGPGRYPFITLTLSGRQDDAHSMRSNASGVGTELAVRSGSNWSLLQAYRNHSGPGQSLQPLAVGLRGATRADFISIDWSDGVFQSEVDVQAGQVQHITETQRQLSSCPVLFAWNGEEYAFVSDFLGVGGIGYSVGPGEYSTPRPWENFLLPEGSLQARNGRYELKIGEPMEEVAYIDSARLSVYDLPPGWHMVMDERMGILGPEPTGEARFYQRELVPRSAVNDRGDDVVGSIRLKDGEAAPVGRLDSRFIGLLQDEHILTLEFSQAIDGEQGDPLLVIDGWVEYPYSQTSFAAWQAGAAYEAPTLEAFAGGQWHIVMEQFGYPAGMPRRMSVPLSGLPGGTRSLRLRTNMQIYWDRIAIAFAEEPPEQQKQSLPVLAATLSHSGFARRSTHEQFRPYYDYAKLDPFWDSRYTAGYYTRFGPVEELVSNWDDAVAIIGPGEEVHLEFNAAAPSPEGWSRFFVLETRGWAKDMDLYTRDGETVGPLPSTGKPEAVRDELHAKYNTRYMSGWH
jgi:tetratricopeptide (TPR) repeat protein